MSKRVWILGAGFSAPLGGPLLNDLFSQKMESDLESHYGWKADRKNPANWIAVNLFRWGLGERVHTAGDSGETQGRRLWQHAEEYLDRLDSALHSRGSKEDVICKAIKAAAGFETSFVDWIEKTGKTDLLKSVVLAGKRWMAGECCVFLKDADLGTERWTPYKNWAKALTADDAILTFNYDTVLETLITNGHGDLVISDPRLGSITTQTTPVFKLHGSVDWKYSSKEQERFFYVDEPESCMTQTLDSFGMATPGPSKKIATGQLKPLWDRALEYLKEASYVYFVGYRFPESDTEAMRALLTAMKQGSKARTVITSVILGPDTNDDRVQRLDGLIKETLKKPPVVLPLYAQDFMTTYAMDKSSTS
ncbi:MAG: hypothetical protein ACI8P0_000986 [Planctomycetaceae bacterium]